MAFHPKSYFLDNVRSDIQSQIDNITGTGGSLSVVGGIQGRVQCISGQSEYTISHSTVNISSDFPVVSLEVADQNDYIFVQGIYDRQPTSFKVVLGGTPSNNHAILYHISTQNTFSSTTLQTSGNIINITPNSGGYDIEMRNISTGSVTVPAFSLVAVDSIIGYNYVKWFVGTTDGTNYMSSTIMAVSDNSRAVSNISQSAAIGSVSGAIMTVNVSGGYTTLFCTNQKSFAYTIKYTREVL